MNALISFLTNGLNLHHNINQSFLVNTSLVLMSFQKLPIENFLNETIVDGHIRFPSSFIHTSNRSQSLRVR